MEAKISTKKQTIKSSRLPTAVALAAVGHSAETAEEAVAEVNSRPTKNSLTLTTFIMKNLNNGEAKSSEAMNITILIDVAEEDAVVAAEVVTPGKRPAQSTRVLPNLLQMKR